MNTIRIKSVTCAVLVAAALVTANVAHAAASDPLRSTLEQSRDDKRGVTLVVEGRDVALVVTEISGEYVIGKSQQHERIVVRIDRIDAALK